MEAVPVDGELRLARCVAEGVHRDFGGEAVVCAEGFLQLLQRQIDMRASVEGSERVRL